MQIYTLFNTITREHEQIMLAKSYEHLCFICQSSNFEHIDEQIVAITEVHCIGQFDSESNEPITAQAAVYVCHLSSLFEVKNV
ncbi:MAG: hypothetical protein [Microvirus sp.]|nr:MAG: hypothetical protein [Microvirus sp.]